MTDTHLAEAARRMVEAVDNADEIMDSEIVIARRQLVDAIAGMPVMPAQVVRRGGISNVGLFALLVIAFGLGVLYGRWLAS